MRDQTIVNPEIARLLAELGMEVVPGEALTPELTIAALSLGMGILVDVVARLEERIIVLEGIVCP